MAAMRREEFLLLVEEIMELPSGSLNGSEKLADLEQWDSLAALSFLALLDEQFGASASGDEIAKCALVNDLVALAGDHIVE